MNYLHQLQNGAGVALWSTADTEGFWNLSAGGHWSPQERWTLSLDYLLAPSYTDIDTTSSGLQQPFPQNWSKLQSARLDVRYQWTKALQSTCTTPASIRLRGLGAAGRGCRHGSKSALARTAALSRPRGFAGPDAALQY